jgi:hypothetical protein
MIPDDFAQHILDGLQEVIRNSLDAWWDASGAVIIGKAVAVIMGALVTWVWQTAGPLLANVQVFTRIPPQWTTDLAPLSQFHQRAQPIAGAALAAILVLSLVMGFWGVVTGRPIGHLLSGIPRFVIITGALVVVAPMLRNWLLLVNGLSDGFFGSAGGLPGFSQMEAMDRMAATGVIGVIWLVFGLWFFVKRIMLIGLVVCLLVAAPFALVAGALPFDQGQRFFSWWLTTFIAATIVQVAQSALLSLGGYMVAAPVITGGAPSDAVQDLTTAGVGGALIMTAAWLPGFLLGALSAGGFGGHLSGAIKTAAMFASFGGGAVAGQTVVNQVYGHASGMGAGWGNTQASGPPIGSPGPLSAGAAPQYASVYQVHPGGNVRSVLSGAPLAPMVLPAPQKALPPPQQ